MARSLLVLGLAVSLTLSGASARAEDKAPDREQIQRLTTVCKVWGSLRYKHPYLAYKDIDWDAALVKALPKVEAAKSADEFAAAVQFMLDELKDPATRVVSPRAGGAAAARAGPAGDKWFKSLDDGVLAVDVSSLPDLRLARGPIPQLTELRTEIAKAGGVIFDCRRVPFVAPEVEQAVLRLACPRETKGVGTRYVVHSGYRPQAGDSSGGYYSAMETQTADAFTPFPKQPAPKSVFLVGDKTDVPGIALALQHAGDSFIVVQGKPSEDLVVPQRSLPLAGGSFVLMRTAERVTPEGSAYTFRADDEVPADADPGTDGPAYKSALALLKDPKASKRGELAAKPLPPAAWRPDKTYPQSKYPDREHRLLGLFRFWNVIHYFYPYKDLLDGSWDAVLPEFLPRYLAAADEREYVLTVQEMAARVQDSHTSVSGSQHLADLFGASPAAVSLRWIEDAAVVASLRDEKAAGEAGVRVGDVVIKVDGETVGDRIKRLGKYVAVSRPEGLKHTLTARMLNGADGSTCKLTLRGADGKEKEAELPRRAAYFSRPPAPPSTHDVFEALPDNFGYVDLTRFERNQIDPMLEKFKDTKGIIFDMRGYPRGVFFALAPRLNVKNAKHAATFQRSLIQGAGSFDESASFAFRQPITATNQWKYQGKCVMLIDERAISQSEHTGLFLEAACGITFIGSHTAGANGDVTNMTLPGGLIVRFGGHDVRHADGRQLQRIGLVPHVEVKPTIKGIREGKDEVLDRAIVFLKDGK